MDREELHSDRGRGASTPRWHDVVAQVVLLAVSLGLWGTRLDGPLDLRWDAGAYYVTGVALAEGRGYSLLNEPGDVAAVQYPPGLPAIVAVAAKLAGTSDAAVVARHLRLVWFLLAIALAQLTWRLARRWLPPVLALLAGLVATLAFPTYEFSEVLFAELPLAVVVALFLLARGRREAPPRPWLLAALGAAGFLLRTIGVALLAGWVAESLLARRWRSAAGRLAIAALPLIGWKAYVASVTRSEAYRHPAYEYQRAPYQFHNVPYEANLKLVDPFAPELGEISAGGWLRRFVDNVVGLPVHVGEALSTSQRMTQLLSGRMVGLRLSDPRIEWFALAALSAIGVFVAAGAFRLARGGDPLPALVIVAGCAILCVTPWPAQFPRYLMPFGAPLAIALLVGLRWLARSGTRGALAWSRRGVAGLAVASLLALEVSAARNVFRTRASQPTPLRASAGAHAAARPFYYDRAWADFDAALDWVRERAAPDDVVATVEAHYAWIRTGRDAVFPPLSTDGGELLRLLDGVPVRWVVVDRFTNVDCSRRYVLPALLAAPERWEPVFATANDVALVFRRRE